MTKYYVSVPFEGSLNVEVEANSYEEALSKGQCYIETMSDSVISESAQFGNYEVYEIK